MCAMIRYAAAALHALLEKVFPARHVDTAAQRALVAAEAENEVLEPRMLGILEAPGARVLEDGTVIILPAAPQPGTAEWTPFDENGYLRTKELADEGWVILGSVKEE